MTKQCLPLCLWKCPLVNRADTFLEIIKMNSTINGAPNISNGGYECQKMTPVEGKGREGRKRTVQQSRRIRMSEKTPFFLHPLSRSDQLLLTQGVWRIQRRVEKGPILQLCQRIRSFYWDTYLNSATRHIWHQKTAYQYILYAINTSW